MVNYTQRVTEPCAFVTKGRQRIKQYGNTVYLNNRDEFEIELFNPTTSKVLAEIYVNGKSIGTSRGIVLRPGERVFLERFLDETRKFLFETYEVNGADPNVQRAIAENGKVEVKFFSEYIPLANISYYGSGGTVTLGNPWWNTPTWQYYSSTGISSSNSKSVGQSNGTITSANLGNATFTSSCSYGAPAAGANDVNAFMCMDNNFESPGVPFMEKDLSIETGRVEKGAHSNQSFEYDYTNFNSWWTWRSEWKILPLSQKPVETRELKVFCTKCGAKQKRHTHKFCPICGTKYE